MTTPILATVLYEDKRGKQRSFGLHDLVVACIADRLREPSWRNVQSRFLGIPLGPNSTVLRAVREEVHLWAPDGHALIALVDDDRVRDLLKDTDRKLDHPKCRKVLADQFRGNAQASVVFLVRNMETAVRAAGEVLGKPSTEIDDAVRTKDHTKRDRFLCGCADADRSVRSAILEKVPSLERLVGVLVPLARARS